MTGERTWQDVAKETDEALSELRKELANMRSLLGAVRAQSASSSPSLAREVGQPPLGNAFSDAETDPTKKKLTFEEFANEAGLTF